MKKRLFLGSPRGLEPPKTRGPASGDRQCNSTYYRGIFVFAVPTYCSAVSRVPRGKLFLGLLHDSWRVQFGGGPGVFLASPSRLVKVRHVDFLLIGEGRLFIHAAGVC